MEGAPQSKSRPTHITEESTDYIDARQEIMGIVPNDTKCFGQQEIESIDKARNRIKQIDEQIKSQKVIDESIISLKHRLKSKLKSVEEIYGAIAFFKEALDLPWLTDALIQIKNRYPVEEERDELHLASLFVNDIFDDDTFETLVRHHLSVFQKKEEEFEWSLPHTLADFRDAVSKAIDEKLLPIDKNLIESRMAEVKVSLVDNLQVVKDIDGDYSPLTGSIRILDSIPELDRYRAIFHEMVHVLSGKTILKKNKEIPDDKPLMSDISIQKTGLSFDMEGESGYRFNWLNEAVTEEINVFLTNTDVGRYREERNMLAELISNGIDKSKIYCAYFENYNPELESKVPEWKALTKKISEVFPERPGTQHLLDVDRRYKIQELETRIARLQEMIQSTSR
jgi:hypothetical protein